MKTRIEFYQAALRPVREIPTVRHLGLGVLAVALLWAMALGWQTLHNHRLSKSNTQLQLALGNAEQHITGLQQRVAQLNQRQDDGQRRRLEQDIRIRRQLLGVLGQDNLVSYAATLDDLARLSWQGVALTGLQLEGRAMTLSGEASNAAAVPAWILGFEGRDSLVRRDFGKLDIHRREPGALAFTLHSDGVTQ